VAPVDEVRILPQSRTRPTVDYHNELGRLQNHAPERRILETAKKCFLLFEVVNEPISMGLIGSLAPKIKLRHDLPRRSIE